MEKINEQHMIVFTLCSNNYLAHAKTLGDSLLKHNPDYTFIIGLIDELHDSIDYDFFEPYKILPVECIGIPDLGALWQKYDIVEFNTCFKASYFKYLFKTYPNIETICFLDPDITVYHRFDIFENEFKTNEILIVPHINNPIDLDGKMPTENLFLNYGLYNLGFIGVHRNCTQKGVLLDWWEERTLTTGFNRPKDGLFVDQLWINLVPIFFDKVKILKNAGLNVAPWNLHERSLKSNTANKEMTDGSPLYFYHFSTYKFKEPTKMSLYYDRYSFENHADVKGIYEVYHNTLLKNKIELFSKIPCTYVLKADEYRNSLLKNPLIKNEFSWGIKSRLKKMIPAFMKKGYRKMF